MEPEKPLHTETMLLPGYANQTLSPEEKQQVTNHLKTCIACQQELQDVTTMQTAIKTSIEKRPGPSPAAFSTLMRRIEQEKQTQTHRVAQPTATPWWESLESAFRSLFEVQWVPALASVLIVGQAFLLFSLMGSPERQRGQDPGGIIERSIPQGTPHGLLFKIRVGFYAEAQEQEIREVLHTIGGRIIDGPSPDGTYTLAFPQNGTATLDTLLTQLRQHAKLIRLAEPLQP
jgi:hypothetical protein